MSTTWEFILEEENGSVLQGLDRANILSVEKTEKGYEFVDGCDCYYGRTLTREQLDKLIEELKSL